VLAKASPKRELGGRGAQTLKVRLDRSLAATGGADLPCLQHSEIQYLPAALLG
jgi:hypothetical protein